MSPIVFKLKAKLSKNKRLLEVKQKESLQMVKFMGRYDVLHFLLN